MSSYSVIWAVILFLSSSGCNKAGNKVRYFNESMLGTGDTIKTQCECFLKFFANVTQHFNWCVVQHAQPLRMCEKCARQYEYLTKHDPVAFNSSLCVDQLIKSERFQVVMKVYDFQTGLWENAHCQKCYASKWNFTDNTKKFFHRLKRVQSCFTNYTMVFNRTADGICSICRKDYFGLRRIYNDILDETTDDKQEDELCVDIMSLMNDTRREWTRYHCNVVKEKHYIVLSLTGFFGFLTIIYYCAMRKHQKYKSKVLTRAQRTKQIVNYDSE